MTSKLPKIFRNFEMHLKIMLIFLTIFKTFKLMFHLQWFSFMIRVYLLLKVISNHSKLIVLLEWNSLWMIIKPILIRNSIMLPFLFIQVDKQPKPNQIRILMKRKMNKVLLIKTLTFGEFSRFNRKFFRIKTISKTKICIELKIREKEKRNKVWSICSNQRRFFKGLIF